MIHIASSYRYGDHRALHSFPTRRSSDLGGFVDHVPFELARHPHGAVAAHADEADAAPGQVLDRRNADFLGEAVGDDLRSEEHTSELQSHVNLVCRLLLEKKKKTKIQILM